MFTAKWKQGFESLHKADAQKVADEIIAIGDDATPQQIVDAAQDPDCELHKCFDWDNEVAADKWRLHQARQVVCHLVIKSEDGKKDVPETRYFYKNDTGGYKPSTYIFRVEDEYQKLLLSAFAELTAFKKKYGHLQELSEILELID